MPITFPQTRLTVKIELALGADQTADPTTWVWTDITDYWRPNSLIQKTVGRPDESSLVDPSTCQLVLDNSDGRFCRTNPNSPYYGLLKKNTPIRISVNPGDAMLQWFIGTVPAWAPRWDMTKTDRYVTITASGSFRRLSQNRRPLDSALLRYNKRYLLSDANYWPMEDPVGSTAAQPGLPNAEYSSMKPPSHSILVTSTGKRLPDPGAPTFGSTANPPGTGTGIDLTRGGVLKANVRQPTAIATGDWNIEFVMRTGVKPSGYTSFSGTIISWELDPAATHPFWTFIVEDDKVRVECRDIPGGAGYNMDFPTVMFDGAAHHFRVNAEQLPDGTTLRVRLRIDDNTIGFYDLTNEFTYFVRNITVNPNEMTGDLLPTYMGHLAVGPGADSGVHYYVGDMASTDAAFGYPGENAVSRVNRLCFEEGITRYIDPAAGSSEPMGPQTQLPLFDLLRECEAADNGILFEYLTGIGYRKGGIKYNLPVMMSLAATDLGAPPEPMDDDSGLKNDVIVKRPDGAEQRAVDEQSIEDSGPFEKSYTLNLDDDFQALRRAQWELFTGTRDDLRYPRIFLDLAARPGKINEWRPMDVGLKFTVSGMPSELGTDTIELFAEGWTETIGWYDWTVEINCSPAEPYNTSILEDAVLGKADTEGSEIAALATTTATSISVATTVGPIWTTDVAQFPFDIIASTGEKMTVTNITGAASPQTFTVLRSINGIVKTLPVGTSIRLANPMVLTF